MIDVTAAIIEKEGKYLIARRKGGNLNGKWEFPGGKLEDGESHEKCLERELDEEFGVKVEIGDYFLENVHKYKWGLEIRLVGYSAKHISGNFNLTVHDKIMWVYVNEMNCYDFAEADIPFIKKLRDLEIEKSN